MVILSAFITIRARKVRQTHMATYRDTRLSREHGQTKATYDSLMLSQKNT